MMPNDTEDDDEDAGDDDAVDADLDIVDTARLKSAKEISIQDKSGDQGLQMFVLHILHKQGRSHQYINLIFVQHHEQHNCITSLLHNAEALINIPSNIPSNLCFHLCRI